MPDSQLAIIITGYNNLDLLARCLEAVGRQTRKPERVIVVDNGSEEHGVEGIRDQLPGLELIRLDQNMGFAVANNLAVQAATGCEWVAFLNNDAFPEPDWIERLLSAARRHPEFSAFASRICFDSDARRLHGTGDAYHVSGFAWKRYYGRLTSEFGERSEEVFSCSASAALYRREVFLKLGGFDEDFFCYFEDVDLGFRLRLTGGRSFYVSDAAVRHVGSATWGEKSEKSLYHAHRNLIWTFLKNMPAPFLLLYLPQHFLFNLLCAIWYWAHGSGESVLTAKRDALNPGAVTAMLKKRKEVQATRKIPLLELYGILSRGLLRPYLRRYD